MEHGRKRGIKDDAKTLSLRNWNLLLQLTKTVWGQVGKQFVFEYAMTEMLIRYPRRDVK